MAFSPSRHFRLRNVRLVSSTFTTAERIEWERMEGADEVEALRWNSAEIREGKLPNDTKETGLFVTVKVGIRRVRPAPPNDETGNAARKVLYCVEAAFRTDFEILDASYSDEDLARFSSANACHLVWPFWREHVFRTLRDAALPLIEVPLLAPLTDASPSKP